MSKVLSLFHIVFATRGRCPALKDDKRVELHRIITAIVTEKRSKMLCINSVSDHLHMLINLSTETSLSEFMAAVKAKSSKDKIIGYRHCATAHASAACRASY